MKEPSHVAYRRGTFTISGHMVRQNPEELLYVFARVVVLEVIRDEFTDSFRYLAVSPDFKLWNPIEASEPPAYSPILTVHTAEDGKMTPKLLEWRSA